MKRLTELRNRASLTQQQLAKMAKVRQASISDWERGEKQPTIASVRKLAKALKTTISELI
jgi:transcriptional regulator with XRE-family HTH domain